ncbi:MAG: MgtC/SapB family protein [Clostridia bacterium]|nr:MgtC/SapB family protein [Clostridia bacterium]
MELLKNIFLSESVGIATVLLRILLTCLLSGVIGFERGFRGRAAGLRTHILVGIGACVTVMTGIFAQHKLGTGDPFRIAAQVMSGIGFLGAGTILVRGKTLVTGLTTAAGLWTTAAIGIAVGAGFYSAAIIGTLMVIFTFVFLTKFELSGRYGKYNCKIYIESSDVAVLNDLMRKLTASNSLCEIEITQARSGIQNHIGIEATLILHKKSDKNMEIEKIRAFESVICVIESV